MNKCFCLGFKVTCTKNSHVRESKYGHRKKAFMYEQRGNMMQEVNFQLIRHC